MEKLSLVFTAFIVELIVDFIILKVFKIKYKLIYILFLQLPKICANILCLIFSWEFGFKVLAKFLSRLLVVVFLADSLRFKRLIKILFLDHIIYFSIAGFVCFIILWIESSSKEYFNVNISNSFEFLIVFGVILYIVAIFNLVRNLSKNKNFNRYLTEVSLSLNNKHIKVYGLVDSGNSLVDPKTKKPVLIISLKSILKLISKKELEKLISNSGYVECETIANCNFNIPILNGFSVKVKFENELIKTDCVVGVVDKKFENGKYDCLLWRDFL